MTACTYNSDGEEISSKIESATPLEMGATRHFGLEGDRWLGSDTPAPGPLNSYSPAKILTCTAISTIENVRFPGLFFFLDRWKEKCFYREFP
jgi:hypothetical protein